VRILVVSNLFPPVVYGGYEILCGQVVDLLRARGHQVEVLTSAFRAEEAPEDPTVHRQLRLTTDFPRPGEDVGHVDFSLKALQWVAQANLPAVRQRIEGFQPDVVFCWCLSRLGLAAVWAAQSAGVGVCYTINDEHARQYRFQAPSLNPRALLKMARERWFYPLATLLKAAPFPVTVISQALKDKLLAAHAPYQHAQVIHQGVPLEKLPFAPLSRQADQPLKLLYVGQLAQTKGVHTLIKAAGVLHGSHEDSCLLTIVGDGVPAYKEFLNSLVAETGLQGRVEFAGKVPHAQIASAYHNHHVLVFSSEWDEPFGLTHVEAMACGCGVVSTTTGGSAELIRDGQNALAYRAGDHQELADRLNALCHDEPLRCRLASQARAYVEKHHSLDGYVTRLEEFLRQAVLA
jgi:glycosyltransferase involved in cell wall biosynthesis